MDDSTESITGVEMKDQDFSKDRHNSSKIIDITQIEKELSNSLKLLESGLLNLDIEAAHFLNSGELKNSFSLNEQYSSSKYNKMKRIEILQKTAKLFSIEQTNISHLSNSSIISNNALIPPELTFSFYSSTDETIIPLTSEKHQIKKFHKSSAYANDEQQSTLDEILRNSEESVFSTKNNFQSKINVDENLKILNPDSNTEKRTRNKFLNTKNDTVLEMNDLVESLLKIQSALNDLDKEAAHIFNP